MKQKYFLIGAVVLFFLLLTVWLYLLFFKTPTTTEESFADFTNGGIVDPNIQIPEEIATTTNPIINVSDSKLRQLTTKPVAGFRETRLSSTTPFMITYAEAGTGHIYEINVRTGEETRISNTTIGTGEVSHASFSADGVLVALRTKNDRQAEPLTIGTLNRLTQSLTTTQTAESVIDFKVLSSSTVVYSHETTRGLESSTYTVPTKKVTALFTAPFYAATIAWGSTTADAHLLYTKPTYALEGYAYQARGGVLSRLPQSGFGLTTFVTPRYIVSTSQINYKPKTEIYTTASGKRYSSPLILLPEKCVPSFKNPAIFWCAEEENLKLPMDFPDSWYQGAISFSDSLWEINPEDYSSNMLVDMTEKSGRSIDAISMSVGESETALYFINKNDNTLWMYEL